MNDEYVDKQVRNAQRELAGYEEKDMVMRQVEDVFNEMNGDGLNRLVTRFFNEFRKLSDEPESPALRESVREASKAMVNDFHRLRKEVDEIRRHIDSKLEGNVREINSVTSEIAELNRKIQQAEVMNHSPNDLLDKRDVAVRKIASYMDVTTHKDKFGLVCADMKGIGPLITGVQAETISIERSPADAEGKGEQSYDVKTSGNARGVITHSVTGGKLGALLEMRDHSLNTVLSRLDEMAYGLTQAVNDVHSVGVTTSGATGVNFFEPIYEVNRAAEFISLSEDVLASTKNIATALAPDSPGDNRIAIAISRLQNDHIMDDGSSTLDDWYNSIVSSVGVASAQNHFALNQQKDIMAQLNKVRDQISGVSLDEETANLLQYQHIYDANAKVIQIADEMFRSVLAIKN
jgi:flagellar hook-associated protein 1 FlgK